MEIIAEKPEYIHISPNIADTVSAWVRYGAPFNEGRKHCALLISRLPRITLAEDEWLRAVRNAIDHACENGSGVISSIGGLGFDYISWYAARKGLQTVLIFPPDRTTRFQEAIRKHLADLELNPDLTTFIMPVTAEKSDKAGKLHLRDRILWDLADRIFPIVVRKGGYWFTLLSQRSEQIDADFMVKYPEKPEPSWKSLLDRLEEQDWGDILIHWTRGTYDPWPGETQAQYFQALTEAREGNPRDAFASLAHILDSGILRGEGRMIRGGIPSLSFTELNPVEAVKLIRYRSALGRWNFEPYGIALPVNVLEELGCKPVRYGDKSLYDQLPEDSKPYYQYCGSSEGWKGEKEWRLIGDIDLNSLKDKIMAITPTEIEADKLRSITDYQVCSLQCAY